MSTSFTPVANGDPLNPAQVNQFIEPINDLEDAVAALSSPDLSDIGDWPAGVTATEVGYLDGVTSAIQTQLDGKAASSHSHAISDTTGLQTALDGKAAASHTHAISDTTGLQTALDGKAASSHTHAISDTTGLQTALDGKAASSHNHAASAINSGVFDKARLDLTTNGDLLTVIGGVLARLGLGSALQVLRVNAAGNGLEYAAPSGGAAQLAIFRRITSNQTGISGSFAVDYLDYNSEVLDEGSHWSYSSEAYTCATAGTYLIEQAVYSTAGQAFLEVEVNGSAIPGVMESPGSTNIYRRWTWVVKLAAGDVVKFRCIASSAWTMPYTDGSSRVGVNQVSILKVA